VPLDGTAEAVPFHSTVSGVPFHDSFSQRVFKIDHLGFD
jgi:hypothetical protein